MQLFGGSLQSLTSMPQIAQCISSALDEGFVKRPSWKAIVHACEQVISVGAATLADALEHEK
jgi:hypothetical protein